MTQQPYPPPMPPMTPPMPPMGPGLPKGQAVASMVCGILSLVLSWLPIGGLVLAILGTAFGGLVLKKVGRGQAGGKGMAIAGLVCGIVGIVVGLIVTLWLIFAETASVTVLQTWPTGPGPVPMP